MVIDVSLFSGEKKKNIINLSSAEIGQRVVSINIITGQISMDKGYRKIPDNSQFDYPCRSLYISQHQASLPA